MSELYHHGIQGQKWGVRRYQNPDGSLTSAGRERYQKETFKQLKKAHDPKGRTIVIPYPMGFNTGVYVHHDNGAKRRQKNSAKINEKIKTSFNKNATSQEIKNIKKSYADLKLAIVKEQKLTTRPIPAGMTEKQGKMWQKQEDKAYLNTMQKAKLLEKQLVGVGSKMADDLLGSYSDRLITDTYVKGVSNKHSAKDVLQSDIYRNLDDLLKERG